MAFDLSEISQHIQNAEEVVRKAALDAATARHFYKVVDVKGPYNLHQIDDEVIFQEGGCGWSPSGDTALIDRQIEPALISVQKEYCKADLLKTYKNYDVNLKDSNVPFEDYVLDLTLTGTRENIEKMIWQGDGVGASFEGVLSILDTDNAPEVNVASGTTATAFLEKVYHNIDERVADKAVIFVGAKVFREALMEYANSTFSTQIDFSNVKDEFVMPGTDGTRIIKVNGLNATAGYDYAVAGDPRMFVFGVSSDDDINTLLSGYDEKELKLWVRMDFLAGTQVLFPELVVVGKRAK